MFNIKGYSHDQTAIGHCSQLLHPPTIRQRLLAENKRTTGSSQLQTLRTNLLISNKADINFLVEGVMRQIIFAMLGLLAFTAVNAASFDCTKARSDVEKMICADEALSKLDESLNAQYQQALQRSEKRDDVIKSQRAWIKNARNVCATNECLRNAYESRIKELGLTSSFGLVFITLPPGSKLPAAAASVPAASISVDPTGVPMSASLLPVNSDRPETKVGICAGPPCCTYEHQSCSASDTQSLIAVNQVVKGNIEFCTRLMKSQWHYLPLNLEHTVTKDEAQNFLSLRGAITDIWPEAGHFDINNDGKPEYLTLLTAYSGAGQGCDIESYVEMNSERSHLVESPLTRLLSSNKCETYQRAFQFESKTYIENRRDIKHEGLDFMLPAVLTEVYIYEGQKKRSVCTFSLSDDYNDYDKGN